MVRVILRRQRKPIKMKKKVISEKSVLRKAVKRGGADDGLFYLWLDSVDNTEYKMLKKVWCNPTLIYEESRKENPRYGILFWKKVYQEFEEKVKKELEANVNKKMKRKKKKVGI